MKPLRPSWFGTSLVLLVLLLAPLACVGGSPSQATAPEGSVATLDARHFLTAPVRHENLTVWPVHSNEPLDLGTFLTLLEAQQRGVAQVTELGRGGQTGPQIEQVLVLVDPLEEATENVQVEGQVRSGSTPESNLDPAAQGQVAWNTNDLASPDDVGNPRNRSGGATVNQLRIRNDGEHPILVPAGTIVKGGQQDRQIGQDFVIPPKSELAVDAFCVEQGRWTNDRAGEHTAGVFQALGTVAPKLVRAPAQYAKDQGMVWANVSATNETLSKANPTSTLLDSVENLTAEEVAFREQLERAVLARFANAEQDGIVGFAYAIQGQPVAVRVFAHPRLLRDHLAAFVDAMGLEADLARRAAEGPAPEARVEDVVTLVQSIDSAEERVEDTAAFNRNGYKTNAHGGNANCYVEARGEAGTWVPVTRDWTAK